MKDYIFCKNLTKADVKEEIEDFYKSNFDMREFYIEKDCSQIMFSGYVVADPQKTEMFKNVFIEGVVNSQNISWTETKWNRSYNYESKGLVSKVENRLSKQIMQHFETRGYKNLDDYFAAPSVK